MSSVNYHADPTHQHALTSRSCDDFIAGTAVHKLACSNAVLQLDAVAFDPLLIPLRRGADRWLLQLANRHKRIDEERFASIFPVQQIPFDLAVFK